MINRFNLRVYGLLIRDGRILVSKENYQGRELIKFPGGGVEYGEGVKEALIREWQEETVCAIEIKSLFYVTEDFIQSAFIEEDQIVSFYYIVTTESTILDSIAEHHIYWVDLDPYLADKFTFPQEKKVFRLVCEAALDN